MKRRIAVSALVLSTACTPLYPGPAGGDAGPVLVDGAPLDGAALDGGSVDAGSVDAGSVDGGTAVLFPPRDFHCVTGAARPCSTTVPRNSDVERTVEVPRDMPPGTHSFVIRTWSTSEPSPSGGLPGFNLDGLDSGDGSSASSATCEEWSPDHTSSLDPAHPGVDNAVAGLVPTLESLLDASSCPGMLTMGCLDAMRSADIAAGAFLIAVELTGLESFAFDDAVEIALFEVAVPGGGAPALAADGRLAPGQTFSTVRTIAAPTRGDVFDGRLRVVFDARVTLPRVGMPLLPLELDGAELRADVSPTGLALGALGATTTVDHLVAEAAMIMPGIEDTVRSVVESIADVQPTADPVVCARVSSGYVFDAVPAVRR